MAVYVDDLFGTEWADKSKWPFAQSCHMTADTSAELRMFAVRLGLRLQWIQYPGAPKEHFDLTASKRSLAVRLGAIPIDRSKAAEQLMSRVRAARGE